jgi:alcohol dehydrogenase (cytochrome c)
MRLSTALLRTTFLVSALLGGTYAGQAQPKGGGDPYAATPTNNWLNYGGDYKAQHYSGLSQVNTGNASKLVAKWVYHLPDTVAGIGGQEQQPIVYNGVMYLGLQNRIDAIDARTGNLLWRFTRAGAGGQRGTAYYDGKVYTPTSDGHLLALDARTGSILWDTKFPDGYGASGDAPMIAGDKLIMSGNRPNGFVAAFDAKTGTYLWKWDAIPKNPGDPGYDTWIGSKPAGAPMWITGSYDPELGLIYYGTGQPDPQWTGQGR